MSDDEPRAAEDLSVPMWVWTLLGFALLTAVVIVVIIWGGGKRDDATEPMTMEPAAETQPNGRPAESRPADAGGVETRAE